MARGDGIARRHERVDDDELRLLLGDGGVKLGDVLGEPERVLDLVAVDHYEPDTVEVRLRRLEPGPHGRREVVLGGCDERRPLAARQPARGEPCG